MNPPSSRNPFDAAAWEYDRARPGYPDELIEEVVAWSGIPVGGRILDVGCGTGQASVAFARRGYRLTCLEPGLRLAAIARRNLAPWPESSVLPTTLEDWQVEAGAFDLVISATAWHHPARDVKYAVGRKALKPRGALAVFINMPGDWEPGLRALVQAAYARHAPAMHMDFRSNPTDDRIAYGAREILESGAFGIPEVRRFPWAVRHHAADYLMLLDTFSGHRALTPAARAALYAALADVIRRRGGAITIPYTAALFMARPAT